MPAGFVSTWHKGIESESCGSNEYVNGGVISEAWTYLNHERCNTNRGCGTNGFSSDKIFVGETPWVMDGFRYNDLDWAGSERVYSFRIEYSNDDQTWTQVFQSSNPDEFLVGNDVTCTWPGVAAKFWRFVMERHQCATIYSIEWRGAEAPGGEALAVVSSDNRPQCADGDVMAANSQGVELDSQDLVPNSQFYPWVLKGSTWYPVCGHYFWNGDGGAIVACRQLGFESGTMHRTGIHFSGPALAVGYCNAATDTSLGSCTATWNNFHEGGGNVHCQPGHDIGVAISCSGGSNPVTASCRAR